ncbi:MAG: DegT/DnrJ/EryC1/StrS family aminotransferase [Pseudomonadota bacterium]
MSPSNTSASVAEQPKIVRRSVNLFDLKRQQARMHERIEVRIAAVLEHGQFILGPEVRELEEKLAEFAGAKHAIAVSSGRDAITMMLMALDVGPGDAVFIPAFTFSATAGAIMPLGATPVFVDVDPVTFNMEVNDLDRAIRQVQAEGVLTPKVIMPVDLYGLPADYPAITEIADRHGLIVAADAAQSVGGGIGDRNVGALAPISAASFYPTKPLGAYGDGGAVFTQNDDLAEAVRLIRTHGRQGDGDEAIRLGMTGRLDSIQAAVLLVKLDAFPAELEARNEIAREYNKRLNGIVPTPHIPDGYRTPFALYTTKLPERDTVRARLQEDGVGTGLFYRIPLHRHPAFKRFVRDDVPLAVSDRLANEVISLPIHPDLEMDEVAYVVERLEEAISVRADGQADGA